MLPFFGVPTSDVASLLRVSQYIPYDGSTPLDDIDR